MELSKPDKDSKITSYRIGKVQRYFYHTPTILILFTIKFLNSTLHHVSQGLWVGSVLVPEDQRNSYFFIRVIQSLYMATMVTLLDLMSEWQISSMFSQVWILSFRLWLWCLRFILVTLKGNWYFFTISHLRMAKPCKNGQIWANFRAWKVFSWYIP